jgi:hypothetical protein
MSTALLVQFHATLALLSDFSLHGMPQFPALFLWFVSSALPGRASNRFETSAKRDSQSLVAQCVMYFLEALAVATHLNQWGRLYLNHKALLHRVSITYHSTL